MRQSRNSRKCWFHGFHSVQLLGPLSKATQAFLTGSNLPDRWYGNTTPPPQCFMERKTHRESWKGEESVKDRFTLPEHLMVPFLTAEYTVDQAKRDMASKVCGLCLCQTAAASEPHQPNLGLECLQFVDRLQCGWAAAVCVCVCV